MTLADRDPATDLVADKLGVADCEGVDDGDDNAVKLALCVSDGVADDDGDGVTDRVTLVDADAAWLAEPLELGVEERDADIVCDADLESVGLCDGVRDCVGVALGAHESF